MRRIVRAAMLLVAATAAAGGAELKLADWAHCAPIELPRTPDKGIVELALTPEVYAAARGDLADLRVVADGTLETAYVIGVQEGATRKTPLSVRLYNRTYVAGKQGSVTVDFGAKVLKDRIEVDTPGTNFRRKVLVEGSDDGQSWQTVRADALLFRIRSGKHGDYSRNAVDLPQNDQRYLRVTVAPGQDDPDRLDPIGVNAWRVLSTPARTAPVPVLDSTVRQKDKERSTEIELDLGRNNLPLRELALSVGDQNFFRRVTVSGRRQPARQTDGQGLFHRKKTREEPWLHTMSGAIYRYSSGGSQAQSLAIDLRGATFRYLLVRIANADDPPLDFEKAELTRLVHTVAFQAKTGKRYELYFGQKRAGRPVYDLPHYLARLRREGVTPATLGASGAPPPTPRPRPAPTLQHKLILWIVLLAALAVLSLMVYRQAKRAQPPPL